MMKLPVITLSLAFTLMGLLYGAAGALAQTIPPNAQPGAIQSYNVQQFNLQRTQPWLFQPIYPEDISPKEPDVRFMQTEGQVLDQPVSQCKPPDTK